MTEPRKTYKSGAERSRLDDVRYDLISPIAWKRFQGAYTDPFPLCCRNTTAGRGALRHIYAYIQRDTGADHLRQAGAHLMELISLEDGGRPDILQGMRRVAATYAEGARKYSDHNWRKGFPFSSLLNHLVRHLINIELGEKTDEDELGHAFWGVLALMEQEETHPELDDRYQFKRQHVIDASGKCWCNPAVETFDLANEDEALPRQVVIRGPEAGWTRTITLSEGQTAEIIG